MIFSIFKSSWFSQLKISIWLIWPAHLYSILSNQERQRSSNHFIEINSKKELPRPIQYPWWQKSLAKCFIFQFASLLAIFCQLEEYIFNCISLLNILLQVCLQPSANLSKSDHWAALNIGQPINSKWKDSSQENSKWKHSNQEKSEPNSEEHFVKRSQKTTDGRLNSVADSDVDKHGTKTGWDYAKSNLLDDEYRGIGNMVS